MLKNVKILIKNIKINIYNTIMTYLIIVESPSKCKKIEEYLGTQYKCIATKGHFRNLKNLKSIKTKTNFEPIFEMDEKKLEHISKIRPIIESYHPSKILLATDDDREGEAISWHICQVFNLPLSTPRIIFHEITKVALEKAVHTPTKINMNLVFSQHSRQILDMIVGFKISPFLWKYLYNNKTKSLSAGRCQTPALKLVYENDIKKIDHIETKYKTFGTFFNHKFELNYEFLLETDLVVFLEKSLNFEHYRIHIVPKKDSIHNSPTPFNTSALLQSVSSHLHYSPKHTMSLCQELYQKGHITYMRTENTKYSGQFITEVSQYIKTNYNENYLGNLSKVEESINGVNPHEAIRVTNLNVLSVDDEKLNTLYGFIRKNTIESCMANAIYNISLIEIDAPESPLKKYVHTIEIPKFVGWKRYSMSQTSETEIQERETSKLFFFQSITPTSIIKPTRIESIVSIQKLFQHYTESSLIKKLEDLGIGRPSTFATIVETIQDRGYVKKQNIEGSLLTCNEYEIESGHLVKVLRNKVFGNEKNKLVITPVGILTIEFLISHFNELFSYDYTKQMEMSLDDTFMGEESDLEKKRETICKECYKQIQIFSKNLSKIEKKTYPIGDSGYEVVFQQFGASLKRVLEDGTIEYKSVNQGLKVDLQRLETGEYTLDELIEIKNDSLGEYEGHPMKIKNGKYGPYVEWGSSRESIKSIKKPLNEISLNDIIEMFQLKQEHINGDAPRSRPKMPTIKTINPNILKFINNDLSIRKNVKTGNPYIFYKREDMTKPEFFSLQKFATHFMDCDVKVLKEWIMSTYIKNKN